MCHIAIVRTGMSAGVEVVIYQVYHIPTVLSHQLVLRKITNYLAVHV